MHKALIVVGIVVAIIIVLLVMIYMKTTKMLIQPGDKLGSKECWIPNTTKDKIILGTCDGGGSNPYFTMNGSVLRPNFDKKKCITIDANGNPYNIADCDGGDNQKWEYVRKDGKYHLVSPAASAKQMFKITWDGLGLVPVTVAK